MNTSALAQQAADQLLEASISGVPCPPVREIIGDSDTELAYRVQAINHKRRIAEGAQVSGYKIGLTNKVIQKQLGVDQPDFGVLYFDREVELGGQLSIQQVMQAKVEVEIALILGQDLPMRRLGAVDLIRAIEFALPSIEIVGSRIRNWDIKITDTIADNASASHYVLGHHPQALGNFDLQRCKMEMHHNGQLAAEGQGSDCLNSPVNAAVWLANTMINQGKKLTAGTILLTGALGKLVQVQAGDHILASIENLGQVSVHFSE